MFSFENGQDRAGRLLDAHSQPGRDMVVDGPAGQVDVETHPPTQEEGRVDVPHRNSRIGDGGTIAAVAVARWAPGALPPTGGRR